MNQLGVLPGTGDGDAQAKFVEQYMMGEMSKECARPPVCPGFADACRMRCIEAPDEPVSLAREQFKTLPCNITISTNYMQQGISDVRTFLRLSRTPRPRRPPLSRRAR